MKLLLLPVLTVCALTLVRLLTFDTVCRCMIETNLLIDMCPPNFQQTVYSDSIGELQPAGWRKCRRASRRPNAHEECLALIRRWRWDDNQRKCVELNYGGCHGTDNLFDTEEQCRSECGLMTRVPPCPPPPVGYLTATPQPGCEFKERMKLETGCTERFVHCANRQPSSSNPCQPTLHAQRLPPDCEYVKVTDADGCTLSVIDCQNGPPEQRWQQQQATTTVASSA